MLSRRLPKRDLTFPARRAILAQAMEFATCPTGGRARGRRLAIGMVVSSPASHHSSCGGRVACLDLPGPVPYSVRHEGANRWLEDPGPSVFRGPVAAGPGAGA